MKRVKLLIIPGVLVGLLAVLFVRTLNIHAAPVVSSASSCGSWGVVKSPNVGTNSINNAVAAVSANDVWAVGYDTGDNSLIEHWNGTQWQVVPTPKEKYGGILYGLSVISANDIWAVGRSFYGGENGKGIAMHWDGTKWSMVPTPYVSAGTTLQSVTAISSTNVWATGSVYETSNGAFYNTLVEHWNGTRWKIVASPSSPDEADMLQSASAVSGKDIWAVGTIAAGGTAGTLAEIEHWNGTQWSMVTPPDSGQDFALNSVTAISANNVWAVGTANHNTLVEHYDGTGWSIVPSPNAGTSSNTLTSVTAVSANNVWAAGYYYNSSSIARTLIEHWNGASWSIVKSSNVGSSNNYLNAISSIPSTTNLWAVGSHGKDFSSQKTLTEYYC